MELLASVLSLKFFTEFVEFAEPNGDKPQRLKPWLPKSHREMWRGPELASLVRKWRVFPQPVEAVPFPNRLEECKRTLDSRH
jgi:hypothetical protein